MKIGIDLTKVSRFLKVNKHFIERVYSESEIREYYLISDENKQAEFLASRWAVKEALYKAIHITDYKSYSLIKTENGEPYIENHPEIKVSISHEDEYAIAMVFVE